MKKRLAENTVKYDIFYGTVPLIGVEVEVQRYKSKDGFKVVRNELYGKKLSVLWAQRHEWKCKCKECSIIGTTLMYPVQWKPQYDGSLPSIHVKDEEDEEYDAHEPGIEWISSIMPVVPVFIETAKQAIEIIVRDAMWEDGLTDKHGRPSYPSFHVHCSLDKSAVPSYYYDKNFLKEVQRTFCEYYPELLALASSCGYTRKNLFFRSPNYLSPDDGESHHIFIAPAQKHYEWRIWEAPPGNVDYYESAMYVSASLTQASLNYNVLRTLEGIGLVYISPKGLDSAEEYLKHVNARRLEALRIAATECSTIVANERGVNAINRMFGQAEERFL